MNFLFIGIAIIFFGTFISINILIVRLTIKSALKKFVIPKLQSYGLTFVDYKWLGPFGTGDFNDNNYFTIKMVSNTGKPSMSIYANVYYQDTENKSMTIRIDTFLFTIERVNYSVEFK